MKRIIILCAVLCTLGEAAYAIEENDVRDIPMGTERTEIHAMIGEPDSAYLGYREIYGLNEGHKALLGYDNEALDSGFILVD